MKTKSFIGVGDSVEQAVNRAQGKFERWASKLDNAVVTLVSTSVLKQPGEPYTYVILVAYTWQKN